MLKILKTHPTKREEYKQILSSSQQFNLLKKSKYWLETTYLARDKLIQEKKPWKNSAKRLRATTIVIAKFEE